MIKLKLQNIFERPVRLAVFMIIIAFVFVYGRLILFSILGLILFISAINIYITQKKSYFIIIVPAIVFCLIFGIFYLVDYQRINDFYKKNFPPDMEYIEDGTYRGKGFGLRGPIIVDVTIETEKIKTIDIVQHQEMITTFSGLTDKIIETNQLDIDLVPLSIHGSIETTEGLRDAITNAVLKGYYERPEFKSVTKIIHYFSKYRLDMTTLNALAILFCIVLVFDYSLQSTLVKGTGPSLNCYNCQTCVGVCPIKIIDGEPYPMTMILATRLGDYEKVKYLARYCVACSRCAGKCPVGDSGPSIAAAAISHLNKFKSTA